MINIGASLLFLAGAFAGFWLGHMITRDYWKQYWCDRASRSFIAWRLRILQEDATNQDDFKSRGVE